MFLMPLSAAADCSPQRVASPPLATLGNRTSEFAAYSSIPPDCQFLGRPPTVHQSISWRGLLNPREQTNLFKFICSMLSTALPEANGQFQLNVEDASH